jgi:hypothetical protein
MRKGNQIGHLRLSSHYLLVLACLGKFDACLFAGAAGSGGVQHMPETSSVPGDSAGLRGADARLRELLAEQDERLAERDAETRLLREQLAVLRSQVADLAAQVKPSPRNSSKPRHRTA